jgi:hypothetical protein
MPAQTFSNDADYQKWLADNPNGFVVNTGRASSPNYMVLHRARCRHISDPVHEAEPGGFTERTYIKVAAVDIESLRDWVMTHGRPDGSFSNECSFCKPTG